MGRLPSITSAIPNDVRRFLDRVREAVEGRMGLVTKQDLVDSGLASADATGALSPLDSEVPNCSTPPAPINLVATGAMTSIILTFGGTNYGSVNCHSHTEVWRSVDNDLGNAVLIGTSAGEMYTDAVGSDASYYYWIRFYNANDVVGPYNAVTGTQGNTAPDISYLMDMLAEQYGSGSEAPFFQLDTDTDINGVTVPAGTYMKAAFIYEAMITSAMVKELAADKVTFGEMSGDRIAANTINGNRLIVNTLAAVLAQITTAYIETGHLKDAVITNAKIADIIQSANFLAGVNGWQIDKNGNIELNDAIFRGTLNIKSADSGERLEITNASVKVYDENDILRVVFGDLA